MSRPGPLPLNPNDFEHFVCDCGGKEFVELKTLRCIPMLRSPIGRPALLPVEDLGYRCGRCGAPAVWPKPEKVEEKKDGNVQQLPVEGNVPDVEQPEQGG